jgi:hypothetical protein
MPIRASLRLPSCTLVPDCVDFCHAYFLWVKSSRNDELAQELNVPLQPGVLCALYSGAFEQFLKTFFR